MKKILFIGCHCDDIELGCAGTIFTWQRLAEIDCVVLSTKTLNGQAIRQISEISFQELGVKNYFFYDFKPSFFFEESQKIYESLLNHKNYDLIFTQESDFHQDHKLLYDISNRVFSNNNLITYQSSCISCPNFNPNFFVEINEEFKSKKLQLLKNYDLYKDKLYFNEQLIAAQMVIYGAAINCSFAEGYKIKKISHLNDSQILF